LGNYARAGDTLSSSQYSGFPTVTNYILLGFVIILLVIIVILMKKKPKQSEANKNTIQTFTQDNSFMKNMVNLSDYEMLQIENSRLRAEIASLRGQIDAMSIRGNQLTAQNKDLQNN